jgi:acyl dehydratase
MPPTLFEDLASLLAAGPTDLGFTEWTALTKESLESYAVSTWSSRSAGGQVAPPLFVLALTNAFLPQLIEVRGAASGVNYGTGEVRFNAPVRAGDRLRAGGFLMDAAVVPGGVQTTIQIRVEIDGSDDLACVVSSLSRWLR